MSKVFAFSTRARQRGSQCCAARLISGNGCSGNEGRAKAPHKRTREKLVGGMKMEIRNGEVPSPSTSRNEHQRSHLTGNSEKRRSRGARHAVSSTRGKALSHCASHNAKP